MMQEKRLPPRGCARRRVSERNRRRRLLARRLKLSPQVTDEGKVCHYNPFKGNFRKLAPHPALRVTFPRRGRLFSLFQIPPHLVQRLAALAVAAVVQVQQLVLVALKPAYRDRLLRAHAADTPVRLQLIQLIH